MTNTRKSGARRPTHGDRNAEREEAALDNVSTGYGGETPEARDPRLRPKAPVQQEQGDTRDVKRARLLSKPGTPER